MARLGSSGTSTLPVGSLVSGDGSRWRCCQRGGGRGGGESGSGSPGTSREEHGACEDAELLLGSVVVVRCRRGCCCCCCCCCCVALRVWRVVGAGCRVLRPGGRPGGGGEGGVMSLSSSSSRSCSCATIAGLRRARATMSVPLPGKRSLNPLGCREMTSKGPSYGAVSDCWRPFLTSTCVAEASSSGMLIRGVRCADVGVGCKRSTSTLKLFLVARC